MRAPNSAADTQPEAPPGYAIERRLGAGAEGGAYLGRALQRGGRRVVLKPLPAARWASVLGSFELLRSAGSPHLPEPIDVVRSGARAWLITAYVDGTPLAPGPAPPVTVVGELLGLARALAELHRLGTHHGDPSLANVLRRPTGGVVLTDFGALGARGSGTPGFLAPEVLAGGGGPAADRFALGCLGCARLFGTVPWPRPEQLAAAASRGEDPRAWLGALAEARVAHPPPPALMDLLAHLLEPEPARRPATTNAVIARLEQLRDALEAGVALPPLRWTVSTRPRYRGPGRADLVEALARPSAKGGPPRPTLVVVAGVPGSGRDRFVRELEADLRVRGVPIEAVDRGPAPEAAPEAGLQTGGEEAGSGSEVPGLAAALRFDRWLAAEAGTVMTARSDALALHPSVASRLVAASRLARACLVIAANPGLAAAIERELARDRGGVALVELREWPRELVAEVVAEALDTPDEALRSSWTGALMEITGGRAGAVHRALAVAADRALLRPDDGALRTLSAALIDETPVADSALARRVLEAHWGIGDAGQLPDELRAGEGPSAAAVAGARRALGGEAGTRILARGTLQGLRGDRDGPAPALELALDSGLVEEVARATLALAGAAPRSPSTAARLLAWAEGPALRRAKLDPEVWRRWAELALARGDAQLALRLVRGRPGCEIELARSLHRLGEAEEALRVVAPLGRGDADGGGGGARWLRAKAVGWRVAVDLGRSGEAAAEFRALVDAHLPAPAAPLAPPAALAALAVALEGAGVEGDGLPPAQVGVASSEAGIWGGMALIYAGEQAEGRAYIAAAIERDPPPALRARAHQLLGNLESARGELRAAAEHFVAARRDFRRAGEQAAGYLLDGSLAGIAWHAGDLEAARRRGRRALGAALARGQHDHAVGCFHNLSMALIAAGQADLARRELGALRRLVPPAAATAAAARLARIEADLLAEGLGPEASGEAAVAYRRAAGSLAAVGLGYEAADARLAAARRARRSGALGEARKDAEAAAALIDASAPLELRLVAALAALERADDLRRLDDAARGLAALPSPLQLRAAGQLRLAWIYDRTLLLVTRRVHGPGHPRGRTVARRALDTLHLLLREVDTMDRRAVLERLMTEDGEPESLRALLGELGELASAGDLAPPQGQGTSAGTPRTAEGPADAHARHLEVLLRCFRRLVRESDLDRLLEQLLDGVIELTGGERAAVVAVTGDGRRLLSARELAGESEAVVYSSSVIERVLAEGEPVLSVDAAADARFDQSQSISHLNLRSVLAVPLRSSGSIIGAVYVDHRLRRGAFTETDLARVEDFADLAALALANVRAVAALRDRTAALDEERRELEARLEASRTELTGLREQARVHGAQARHYRGMIGACAEMHRVFHLVDRLADAEVPVVIYGESGTGKELVARAIHDAGARGARPFVAENCGAIPETLLESVLFGHARGAFTGAHQARPGLFEAAHGGTIFLDEIGEMSPGMQTKLLRVLQEGEVRRLGENSPRKVDVRLLAASNRDLDAMVEAGSFRHDLYYRVNVVRLELPPLRARREDLVPLIQHFLERHGGRGLEVSGAVMRALARYPWPGNLRELENEVQRWVALCEGRVEIDDLGASIRAQGEGEQVDPDDLRLRPRIDRLERELIGVALSRTDGNQTQAAQLLGLSRYGLQKKLKRLEGEDAGGRR